MDWIGLRGPRRAGSRALIMDDRGASEKGQRLLLLGALLLVAVAVYQDPGVGLLLLGSFACTWWIVPQVAILARRVGAMARPGGRAINRRATPLLGGAAVAFPIAGALLIIGFSGDQRAFGLAAGAVLMGGLGAYDDIRGVRPRTKILVQLMAGCCLIAAGFHLPSLGINASRSLQLGVFEIPVILCWVVLATNAFNLIDGMDGLASTVGFLAALGCVFVGVVVLPKAAFPDFSGPMPEVALVMAGACLGFLRHNLPPARIFLGDCGSLLLGFVLAALVLTLPPDKNVPLTLGIMFYPLADVILAVLRRFVRGKPLFAADRSHVHHKALHHLGSTRTALAAIAIFTIVPMAVAILWPGMWSIAFDLVLWGALAASLVWLGRLHPARVLADRGPLRQLYVVRRYVSGGLKLAQDQDDVARLLRHMTESLRLSHVRVGSVQVLNELPAEISHDYRVMLKRGQAVWGAVPLPTDGVLDEERQTILTDLLRQADERLRSLEPAAKPVDHPAVGRVPVSRVGAAGSKEA